MGWLLSRTAPRALESTPSHDGTGAGPAPVIPDDALHAEPPTLGRAGRVLAVGLLAWGLPLLAAVALTGRDSVLPQEGLFFSGTALVTFGGAYAVLAHVAQRAVEDFVPVT